MHLCATNHTDMLQRIQTIYLLIASLALGALFVPGNSFINTDPVANYAIYADGQLTATDSIALMIVFGAAALFALVAMFMFKTRPMQSKITRLALICTAIGLGFLAYLIYMQSQRVADGTLTMSNLSYGMAWISPFVSAFSMFLANRGIKKDEALVRSADRLR
jgi:drug/metabolite transporter (DMT)-like permease